MSSTKRGGLGRGLASLIPTGPTTGAGALGGPKLGNAAADVVIGTGAEPASAPGATPGAAKASKGTKAAKKAGAAATADGFTGNNAAEAPASVGSTVYREIPLGQIEANPKQPRQVFDEEALAELVHSIREFGLMQPIVVRPVVGTDGSERFQIVMGERRWRASQEAGLERVPAIVRPTEDEDLLRDALLENIHRVQLNPLEEAAAYQQLLDEFGVTHEELATRLGRSRPVITNMIRLLRLPVPVQRRVAAGVLSAGHARALLGLETGVEAQEALAARVVAEGLSVRATEEAVTLANRDGAPAPKPARRKPIQIPHLQDVATRLSDEYDTKVTVSLGKRKGKIVVEFGSVDDLERIVALMDQGKVR